MGADAGDDILQGFEHQLQEQAEDVTPYYMQKNSHSSTSYPYITYEVPPYYYDEDLDTTYLLTWVLIFLGLLVVICTIIMIVLCVKVCCQNEVHKGVPNGTHMVPPPFVYVQPFMTSSQLQNGNNLTPNMTNNVQNTFHE